MRKYLKRFFRWLFREEFAEWDSNLDYIKEVVGDKEASCNVDVHVRTPSGAVINLAGKKRTYLKFIKLDDKNCMDIVHYLKQFEQCDIDATPSTSKFMKCDIGRWFDY